MSFLVLVDLARELHSKYGKQEVYTARVWFK